MRQLLLEGRVVAATVCFSVTIGNAAADDNTCAGDIAASVVGTFFATLLLCLAAGYLFFRIRTEREKNKARCLPQGEVDHLSNYAYDNPYFHDDHEVVDGRLALDTAERGEVGIDSSYKAATDNNKNHGNAVKAKKGKLAKANLLSVLTSSKVNRQRAQDDSCLSVEPEVISVPLRGIDFTGLGFNVCGNMRDGIFIKDVLHRGPAMESGKIKAGDRILSVTVSFTNMVYEDALTILSYASPYNVELRVQKMPDHHHHIPGHQKKGSNESQMMSGIGGGERLYHPLYRSHSIADLSKIGRDDTVTKRSSSVGGPGKVQQPVKKETFVRASSQSLREEGAMDVVDVGGGQAASGDAVVDREPASLLVREDDAKHSAVSRFKVQKVAEVEEGSGSKLTKNSRHTKRSSSESSDETLPDAGHDGTLDGASVNDVAISFTPDEVLSSAVVSETRSHPEALPVLSPENVALVGDASISSSVPDKYEWIVMDSDIQKSLETSGSVAAAKRNAAAGKRKAPPPPQSPLPLTKNDGASENGLGSSTNSLSESQHGNATTLKVSPDIHEVPSWVKDKLDEVSLDGVDSVAIQTNFTSDSDTSASDGGGTSDLRTKKKRRRMVVDGGVQQQEELPLEHARAATKGGGRKHSKDKQKNRRATSLGDLTKVEESGQKGFPLERSVSMDLNHAEALPVHGQLGIQREQIENKLAVTGDVGGGTSDDAIAPIKNHFMARENLHLDNIYKKSWENLEQHGLDRVENSDNSLPSPELVCREDASRKEDGMSDVTLSDREMSDVSSSLSDDSIDGRRCRRRRRADDDRHQVVAVKKMLPVDVSQTNDRLLDSSSDGEDGGAVTTKEEQGSEQQLFTSIMKTELEDSSATFIHHDETTGSSLVTIGSPPPIPHPRAKHAGPGAKIDPEMAKIFSNITVSNASKDSLSANQDTEEHNGSSSPDDDRVNVISIEGALKNNGNHFGLESPPPALQPAD